MYHTILNKIKQQIYIDYSIFIPNEISNIIRNFCLDRCLNPSIKNELGIMFSDIHRSFIFIVFLNKCKNFDDAISTIIDHLSIQKFNLLCSIYDIKHLDNKYYYTTKYYWKPKLFDLAPVYYRMINATRSVPALHECYYRKLVEMNLNPYGFFKN